MNVQTSEVCSVSGCCLHSSIYFPWRCKHQRFAVFYIQSMNVHTSVEEMDLDHLITERGQNVICDKTSRPVYYNNGQLNLSFLNFQGTFLCCNYESWIYFSFPFLCNNVLMTSARLHNGMIIDCKEKASDNCIRVFFCGGSGEQEISFMVHRNPVSMTWACIVWIEWHIQGNEPQCKSS